MNWRGDWPRRKRGDEPQCRPGRERPVAHLVSRRPRRRPDRRVHAARRRAHEARPLFDHPGGLRDSPGNDPRTHANGRRALHVQHRLRRVRCVLREGHQVCDRVFQFESHGLRVPGHGRAGLHQHERRGAVHVRARAGHDHGSEGRDPHPRMAPGDADRPGAGAALRPGSRGGRGRPEGRARLGRARSHARRARVRLVQLRGLGVHHRQPGQAGQCNPAQGELPRATALRGRHRSRGHRAGAAPAQAGSRAIPVRTAPAPER